MLKQRREKNMRQHKGFTRLKSKSATLRHSFFKHSNKRLNWYEKSRMKIDDSPRWLRRPKLISRPTKMPNFRPRRRAEDAAANFWQEEIATQNEVLRDRGSAQRIEEEAKLQADLGNTNQYAKALEIEELKRALTSKQQRAQESEAMKNQDWTLAERLAALEEEKTSRRSESCT